MPSALKQFLLRLLLAYPLSLALWYALWKPQVELVSIMVRTLLELTWPVTQLTDHLQEKSLAFSLVIPANRLAGLLAGRPAMIAAVVDPLILLSGLPLFTALMLAAHKGKALTKPLITGLLIILSIGALGVYAAVSSNLLGSLAGIGANLPAVLNVPAFAPVVSVYLELLTVYIAPFFLPIALWAWYRRDFIRLCMTQ
jgi:hypothetical protein